MQISPWTTELRFPVGHRDGAARWSDLLPANTGKPKYFTLPSRKNRNFKTAIISTVCLALLALVLSVYFCRSPRGLQKPSAPVLRRLANNGGDESFQELYDLIESFCEDESMVSSMSQEILQSRGLVINTGSRKRGHSASNQDEEAEQAKRPLIEGEHQKRAEGLSAPPDPSASSSAQASKAQQQTVLAQAHQLSGHLHSNQEGHDEVNRPSVAPGVGTVSDEGISSANFAVLEDFFAEENWVDQWFLDYILDPSPTSSPQSDLDHSADSQDAGQETTANAAGQIHPSSSPEPESPSSGAHDSASEGDQLPVSKADDMQECQSSAADESASEDDQLHVSKADDMQGSQSSATDESAGEDDQLPASKADDMQGSQSSAADESASEGDQLPVSKADDMQGSQKTSEVSEEQGNNPASLQESPPPAKPKEGQGGSPSQSTSINEALEKHPLYRLPKAILSDKLVPFHFARATLYTRRSKLPVALTSIQELLVKEQILPEEAQSLIMLAEKLIKNTFFMGKFAKGTTNLWDLYEPVMRRFLVADALWCICEVIGPPMRKEEWWKQVMDRLVLFPSAHVSFKQMYGSRFDLLRRLISALHIYRSGNRPTATEVVHLKKEIFSSPQAPSAFRARDYDAFREYIANWSH